MFDRDQLQAMGCGGMLGVNAGSVEPPRMVKLTYTPRQAVGPPRARRQGRHVRLRRHQPQAVRRACTPMMKMDMSGAAAVLAAMTRAAGARLPKAKVTGYLMCTDNMPSGSAMKLGDVLTIRNGKTVEIHNTDAEGRLDAGRRAVAGGRGRSPTPSSTSPRSPAPCIARARPGDRRRDRQRRRRWSTRCKAAAARADEPVWQLPLADGVPQAARLATSPT